MSVRLIQGDCLTEMAKLPSGSVDAIICDPPFGTTQNRWDSVIPLDQMWAQYWRVLKPNGAVVLHATQPFSSALVTSQRDHFRYEWIWRKANATGHLNARRQPLREHEVVLVFCRETPPYNAQGLIPHNKITRRSGNGTNFGDSGAENFQEWTNWPKTILSFGYDATKVHPTQKPVALMEYLIRTYTNPGDTVLDNTMGSGTTGVAAVKSGRSFIGIERDPEYFRIASERVRAAQRAAGPVVDLDAFRRVAKWNAAVAQWRVAA